MIRAVVCVPKKLLATVVSMEKMGVGDPKHTRRHYQQVLADPQQENE